VKALLNFKPKRFSDVRLRCLVCLFLDSGLRMSEGLELSKADVDFDTLIIRVKARVENTVSFRCRSNCER
jgi:integrase